MKFKNTTSTALEQMPTDDSIVVTTDTSLVGYCADNVLYRANKPDRQLMDEPNVGLIKDGILNQMYANKLEFGSNNGALTCKAYQEASAYRLSADVPSDLAWIRWKVDFDNIDSVYIKSQKVAGYGYMSFRIFDTIFDPSVGAYNIPTYEDHNKIYTENISKEEQTVNVSTITGVHWMYIFSSLTNQSAYHLFDIELRSATN